MDEDLEEIRQLNEIINAEYAKNDDFDGEFFTSESEEESEEEDEEVEECISIQETECQIPIIENVDVSTLNDFESIIKYLTFEEFNVINNCSDINLKQLLILNRIKSIQLKTLKTKYSEMQEKLCNKIKRDDAIRKKKAFLKSKCSWAQVGFPYFRDKANFPSPQNADVQRRRQNNETVVTHLHCRTKAWTKSMQTNLKVAVMKNYFNNLLASYQEKLGTLQESGSQEDVEDMENTIENLKSNVLTMQSPGLWQDDHIAWYTVADEGFGDAETAASCRAFWNLYVHPKINKTPIEHDEAENLLIISEKYGYQNWEQIAIELGNDRSPYMLCIHYFSKLKQFITSDRFTEDEDRTLLEVIDSLRIGDYIPWSKVSYEIGTRSKSQLYHRYKYNLSHRNIKTGPFSDCEDILIMCMVKKFGENYDKIVKEIPHRSKSQLRSHYQNYLRSNELQIGNWTIQEDQMLLEHVKIHGKKLWVKLGYSINRNSAHVRHRYNCIERKMLENPNVSLADLPRRIFSNSETKLNMTRKEKMNSVAHYLNSDTLPAIEKYIETKKTVKSGQKTRQRTVTDNILIDFFRTTAKIRKARKLKSVSLDDLDKCASSVSTILDMLGANLNIPEVLSNPELNDLDVEILTRLKTIKKIESDDLITEIPPSVGTLQALRALLLKYQEYNNRQTKCEISVAHMDPRFRQPVEIFHERFKALFRWPCIMSIQGPKVVKEVAKVAEPPEIVIKIPAQMGRPKKKGFPKVEKMNAARLLQKQQDQPSTSSTSDQKTKKSSLKAADAQKLKKQNSALISAIASHNERTANSKTKIKNTYCRKRATSTVTSSKLNKTDVQPITSVTAKSVTISEPALIRQSVNENNLNVNTTLHIANEIVNEVPIKNVEEVEKLMKDFNKTTTDKQYFIKIDKAMISKLQQKRANDTKKSAVKYSAKNANVAVTNQKISAQKRSIDVPLMSMTKRVKPNESTDVL